MFFDDDSSSGVSGDLESATTVASFMEGFWGMGATVSSYSTAKRLEVGAPGGGAGGRKKKGQDPEADLRHALADRIEDNLTSLLVRVESIIRECRPQVLSLAHALETHKTLSGEDVVAVIERSQGPILDGRPYADTQFQQQLEDYHRAAAHAHRTHGKVPLSLPVPAAVAPTASVAALDAGPAFDGGPQNGDGPQNGEGPQYGDGPVPGGTWAPGDWAPDGGWNPDGGTTSGS